MQRTNVDSSNIVSIGYDASIQALEIEFYSNSVYQYSNVPQHVYDEIMAADSHGKYLNNHIKNKYSYRRVL